MPAELVCEAAARLLFMSIKWAKSLPAFVGLPTTDQLALIRASWAELFVLGAAQFRLPIVDDLVTSLGRDRNHRYSKLKQRTSTEIAFIGL